MRTSGAALTLALLAGAGSGESFAGAARGASCTKAINHIDFATGRKTLSCDGPGKAISQFGIKFAEWEHVGTCCELDVNPDVVKVVQADRGTDSRPDFECPQHHVLVDFTVVPFDMVVAAPRNASVQTPLKTYNTTINGCLTPIKGGPNVCSAAYLEVLGAVGELRTAEAADTGAAQDKVHCLRVNGELRIGGTLEWEENCDNANATIWEANSVHGLRFHSAAGKRFDPSFGPICLDLQTTKSTLRRCNESTPILWQRPILETFELHCSPFMDRLNPEEPGNVPIPMVPITFTSSLLYLDCPENTVFSTWVNGNIGTCLWENTCYMAESLEPECEDTKDALNATHQKCSEPKCKHSDASECQFTGQDDEETCCRVYDANSDCLTAFRDRSLAYCYLVDDEGTCKVDNSNLASIATGGRQVTHLTALRDNVSISPGVNASAFNQLYMLSSANHRATVRLEDLANISTLSVLKLHGADIKFSNSNSILSHLGLSNLKNVDMSSTKLSHSVNFAKEFENARFLMHLNLADNALGGQLSLAPFARSKMPHLRDLNLARNNFGLSGNGVPDCWTGDIDLSHLYELRLQSATSSETTCKLPSTFPNAGSANLRLLDLGNLNIQGELPEWIVSLPHLYWLSAKGNGLTRIPASLAETSITHLFLVQKNDEEGAIPDEVRQMIRDGRLVEYDFSESAPEGDNHVVIAIVTSVLVLATVVGLAFFTVVYVRRKNLLLSEASPETIFPTTVETVGTIHTIHRHSHASDELVQIPIALALTENRNKRESGRFPPTSECSEPHNL